MLIIDMGGLERETCSFFAQCGSVWGPTAETTTWSPADMDTYNHYQPLLTNKMLVPSSSKVLGHGPCGT